MVSTCVSVVENDETGNVFHSRYERNYLGATPDTVCEQTTRNTWHQQLSQTPNCVCWLLLYRNGIMMEPKGNQEASPYEQCRALDRICNGSPRPLSVDAVSCLFNGMWRGTTDSKTETGRLLSELSELLTALPSKRRKGRGPFDSFFPVSLSQSIHY